jgi:hypothetical protein
LKKGQKLWNGWPSRDRSAGRKVEQTPLTNNRRHWTKHERHIDKMA